MKGKKHRASGGAASNNDVREDMEGTKADDATPSEVYAGKGSNVEKEAAKRKRGGMVKCKDGGKVDGKKGHHRLDRKPRKSGGRVGAETRPLSMASKVSERPGGKVDSEDD